VSQKRRLSLLGLDGEAILKDAKNLLAKRVEQPSRRSFLRNSLTLGGLAMLSGCSLSDDENVEKALSTVSRFNDRVQGWLFDPNKLAPTYPESMITRPFPFNAYYGIDEVRHVDEESFRLEVTGMVADKRQWRLEELRAMAQIDQVTRDLRGRLERHRQMGRCALLHLPETRGRRPDRQVRGLQVR